MKNKILKSAVIGYGYMGEIRRKVIDQHPNLELLGVCETDSLKRKSLTEQDVRLFDNIHDVLAENPDVVFVCTPNVYSPDICITSLKANKHVFCEKPPGRDLNDIINIRAHESDGLKLMFGFNHRFHPGILKAKRIVESGRLGKIINVRGVYGKSGGSNFKQSWRNNKKVSGGGILLDQGIHMLDLFRFFCGDFQHVKCFGSNSFWKFDIEDNAYVILKSDQGCHGMCHSSATLWKHTFQIQLTLEEGFMTVEGLLSKSGSYGRERLILARRQFEDETAAVGNPSEEMTYFDQDLSWELEVDAFVQAVLNDTPVQESSSQDALKVMEIIDMAYQDANVNQLKEGDIREEHCRI